MLGAGLEILPTDGFRPRIGDFSIGGASVKRHDIGFCD